MVSQRLRSLLKMVFVCLTVAGTSQAGIVYSAPPNQSGGSDLNSFLEADDVTLTAPASITRITFWSLQGSAADYSGSIAWSINADTPPGIPGAVVTSGSATPAAVSTGVSAFGLNEFMYSFPVSASLGAGTFWVALHNGPTDTLPTSDFFWEWSNGNSGNSQSQDLSTAGNPWTSNFAELSLQLEAVPEPASMLLLGAGLLALGFVRSRTR